MSAELFKDLDKAETIADLLKIECHSLKPLLRFIESAKDFKKVDTFPALYTLVTNDYGFDEFYKASQQQLTNFFNSSKDIFEEDFDVFLFKLFYFYKEVEKRSYEAQQKENIIKILLFLIDGLKNIKVGLEPAVAPSDDITKQKLLELTKSLPLYYENYKVHQAKLKLLDKEVERQITKLNDKLAFERKKIQNCKPHEKNRINRNIDCLLKLSDEDQPNNLTTIQKEIKAELSSLRPKCVLRTSASRENYLTKFNGLKEEINHDLTKFSEDHGFRGWLIQFRRNIHNIIKMVFFPRVPSSAYSLLSNTKTACKTVESYLKAPTNLHSV